jgi:hypothetical protein
MAKAIVCSLFRLAIFVCLLTASFAQNNQAFPLAAVIAQVKKELAAAQNIPGQSIGLALKTVELTFAITHTVDVSGKVAIGVPILSADIGGNGERKAEDSSTLTVELAPPSASITMAGVDSTQFGITQAIVATRKQLAQGLNDEPKLEPRKVSLQFKFGVTRTGGATGQIKFVILTVGGGATKSAGETSTITLNFEKK